MNLGNKISSISGPSLEDFSVEITFVDGFKGRVRLGRIFKKPVGLAEEILKGNLFTKCFVESGALAWPNGFELCPDAIRMWMEDQTNKAS